MTNEHWAKSDEDLIAAGQVKDEQAEDQQTDLESQLASAQQSAEEYKAQLLRSQADFINFRRRSERERAQQMKYANEQLLKNMLPVWDNLQRALEAAASSDSLDALMEGVSQVAKYFLMVLDREGVKPLEPGIGQPFDPEHQEALACEDLHGEIVTEELLMGWSYHDRVLRPTLVRVGSERADDDISESKGDIEEVTGNNG